MTTTAGLGITLLEARQTQPHIVVNEAISVLDRAAASRLAIDMTALATLTLTGVQSSYTLLNPYGTPSGDFDFIVNGTVKQYLLINDTANVCTLKAPTGTVVVIQPGKTVHCYFDGTNMHAVSKLDSGWIDSTLLNSWTNTGGSWPNMGYRLIDDIIYLRGQIDHAAATAGSVIATLPTGFRPSVDKQIGLIDSASNMRLVELLTTGDVVYQSASVAITRLSFDGVVIS